ncbi:MAG: 1-acyl-sn-glycerol-3-phosphate acyltransferase [Deltaproteobacteria bacterium]|nr:MAG: 1-acyl-sn-glycerol-3-phosphate acyltransferase [Deltaproteobacteria bacterium]
MALFKRKPTKSPADDLSATMSDADLGCSLGRFPTSILDRLLDKVFSKASFLESQQHLLQDFKQRGLLVYSVKHRSQLDFLFLNSRLRLAGLRPPGTAFDMRPILWLPAFQAIGLLLKFIRHYVKEGHLPNPYQTGYYRELVRQRESSVLFLLAKGGYYRRFGFAEEDPLHLLIEMQRQIDYPITLVPSLIFHGKGPEKRQRSIVDIFFGNKERPGRLRKLVTLLRNYKHNVLEIAEPLNLMGWLTNQEIQESPETELAFQLRRELIDRTDGHRRVVTGPVMKSRLEIKEIVVHNRDLQKSIERRARANNKSLEAVRMEADGYLNEIASDYNMTYVQLWDRLLTWTWGTIFDGIDLDVDSLNMVKQAAAKRVPLVYVPCHKSHMDYMILSYLLFKNNLSTPYVAAGKNLAFWPLGPVFRKSGAFFIRRSFRGQKFYAEVFAAYIKTLVNEGYNIEFFIEGGRSRTGKLVLPKLGLLVILMQAVQEGYCDDLIFVPTTINYDRVLEEGAYLREVKGSRKQDENLSQLVRARSFLRKRYGKVYVRFAQPTSLRSYMERFKLEFETMHPKERHAMYRDFAWRIIHSINSVSLITPFSLVAAAFLTSSKRGISLAEAKIIVHNYYDYLKHQGVRMADTLQDLEKTVQDTLGLMEKSKWLELLADEEETEEEERIYTIDDSNRLQLEYYKNNLIHFLLPAAYVSTAILAKQAFDFDLSGIEEDLYFFRDFFKFEFVYDADEDLEVTVEEVLNYCISRGFIIALNNQQNTYRISHQGLKALSCFASFLRSYFESYWIVLRATKYLAKKPYSDRDFLKKISVLGNKLYKLEIVERFESISRITFENGLQYFCEKGVIRKHEKVDNGKRKVRYEDADNKEAVSYYNRMIDRYLRNSHFTFQ